MAILSEKPSLKADQSSERATIHSRVLLMMIPALALIAVGIVYWGARGNAQKTPATGQAAFDAQIIANAQQMLEEGRQIFRFDTFGDEAWWSDKLKLHQAIEGSKLGGAGSGVSPKTALAVGLKVDMDALPPDLVEKVKAGQVNLDDPATTLALIKLNSVLGVKVGERWDYLRNLSFNR